jgi:hypothetical protein
MQGLLKGDFLLGNKIRLSPNNENVKRKLLGKSGEFVSFLGQKIFDPFCFQVAIISATPSDTP